MFRRSSFRISISHYHNTRTHMQSDTLDHTQTPLHTSLALTIMMLLTTIAAIPGSSDPSPLAQTTPPPCSTSPPRSATPHAHQASHTKQGHDSSHPPCSHYASQSIAVSTTHTTHQSTNQERQSINQSIIRACTELDTAWLTLISSTCLLVPLRPMSSPGYLPFRTCTDDAHHTSHITHHT